MIEQKDGIQIIEIYGDESGSISNSPGRKFPFFNICLVSPVNTFKLKNHFKKWKIKMRAKYGLTKDAEVKGSILSDEDIEDFVSHFIENTSVYIGELDCAVAKEKLLSNSKITYNFIVNKILERIIESNILDNKTIIRLELDQINNGVSRLKSLEDYLNASFMDDKRILKIVVHYYESHLNWKVQVADIYSHYYYRRKMNNQHINKQIKVRKIY